ncbi:arsinothricin resistance N-acetyltransferase ArsN1 family B [Massilia sp. W12]|uniref:arsinothricin resistance N-acetyltransferase ArsN1 family B n=1 Tax=Massilia sp. W12 TaxID=3126507 RepID=UPI0030D0045B
MTGYQIRPASGDDAAAIAQIYSHYILHTTISFETEAVDGAEIAQRMQDVQACGLPWLVLCAEGQVQGWAYASRWRTRCAYRGAVELSVYLAPQVCGRGWGEALYRALLQQVRAAGLHTAIGGIALPNPASVALHEKLGMRKVAHFEQVGRKFEQYIDVGYWQMVWE